MRTDQADIGAVRRLATSSDGAAGFLAPHHLVAAERMERLIERSQLMARVTMSYDPARIGTRGQGGNAVAGASDTAAEARARLNALAQRVPADCWGVLIDVCGLGKGLQQVETERRWPRRSAKLVLRIGLEQLATLFGLSAHAQGEEKSRNRGWLPERLPLIAESAP